MMGINRFKGDSGGDKSIMFLIFQNVGSDIFLGENLNEISNPGKNKNIFQNVC